MAKLCPPCQAKQQPPGIHRGSCNAQVSADCTAWTEDFAFTLCDPCAEQTEMCSWCLGPLDGSWRGVEVPTTKLFRRAFDNESGTHITGMNVDEQICVQLVVDLWSGYVWRFSPARSSRDVSLYGWRVIRDTEDWNLATMEIYIDLNGPAEAAKIVIEEVPDSSRRGWWWTPPSASNKTWQCTVEIKR